jgi:predicted lipoprotein with Yx(FWY)xxD motif
VATAADVKLGMILTDGHGATLYLFEKDTANHSNCTGTCAGDWIPFTTSAGAPPVAGPGTTAAVLATITRADGSTQVTYNAHPLYYYSDDKKKPGSVEGQGSNEYGGLWHTVTPAGTADTAKK